MSLARSLTFSDFGQNPKSYNALPNTRSTEHKILRTVPKSDRVSIGGRWHTPCSFENSSWQGVEEKLVCHGWSFVNLAPESVVINNCRSRTVAACYSRASVVGLLHAARRFGFMV